MSSTIAASQLDDQTRIHQYKVKMDKELRIAWVEVCFSGKAPEYPPESHQLFQVKNGKCELLNLKYCRRLEAEGRERECRVCETYCPRDAVTIDYQ